MARLKRTSLADAQRPPLAEHPRNLEELVRVVQGNATLLPEETNRIPIEKLKRGRYQPRHPTSVNTDTELADLADSIRALGLIEPIAVRPDPEAAGMYEILAGDRRWRAAQLAGLTEVPIVVHRVNDQTAAAIALVENLQRQDLNPLDEAGAMHRLLEEFRLSQAHLGRLLGKSRSAISRTLGLLTLADRVQQFIREGQLEAGHARVLINLDEATQAKLAGLAVTYGWSVRELETRKAALMTAHNARLSTKQLHRDPNISRLEERMCGWLAASVKVRINQKGGGTIVIRFSSTEECDGILEKIGFVPLEEN